MSSSLHRVLALLVAALTLASATAWAVHDDAAGTRTSLAARVAPHPDELAAAAVTSLSTTTTSPPPPPTTAAPPPSTTAAPKPPAPKPAAPKAKPAGSL